MGEKYGPSSFSKWIAQEAIPVAEGYGIERVLDLPRGPWKRVGGLGTYIKLQGMEGITSAHVTEIPPGDVLNPEKHLHEEIVYVLEGSGSAEMALTDGSPKVTFEWQAGSLF